MRRFNVKKSVLILLVILMGFAMGQGAQTGMMASFTEGSSFDSFKDTSFELNLMNGVKVQFEFNQDDFDMDYILLAGATDTTTPEPSTTNKEGSEWAFNIQTILSDFWAHS